MLKKFIISAAVALTCVSGIAAAAAPAGVGETNKGKVLVDGNGMTLYTFSKDAGGKSVCNGPCATNWPPLLAPAGAAGTNGYSVISRDDGTKQWAYKNKPLYTWVKDKKPGDITGDGVNEVWQLAKP